MDTNLMKRAAGAVSIVAMSAAVVVACSQENRDAAKESMSSATSAASSAISAGGSAASSAASSASSAASSAVAGAPSTVSVPGVGDVTLEPAVAEAYTKAGGEAKLGLPTGQPDKVGDGTVQAFAKGTIFSSPAGTHLVQGEILKVYTAQGGAGGALGFPTADEAETAGGPDVAKGGWIGEFQKGTITWLNQGDGTFKDTVTPK
ncbi:MAG: LGFP repeat-containing protein [Mycobacterium sp.]